MSEERELQVWVLHGPNLNMLGTREPQHYGRATLAEIDETLKQRGHGMRAAVTTRQSNHEGHLIDWIQEAARTGVDAIVINAASHTHTSIGIHDALAMYDGVKIEVHLSNVWKREAFRHHSMISDVVDGVIAGLGPIGYELALQGAIKTVRRRLDEAAR